MTYMQDKFLLGTYKILTHSDTDHTEVTGSATLYEVYKSNSGQNAPSCLGPLLQIWNLESLAPI